MSIGIVLILMLGTVLAATRPWRSQDEEWFQVSALVAAVLLGAFLLAIA